MTAPDHEPAYWRLVDILGAARNVTITYADDGHSALTTRVPEHARARHRHRCGTGAAVPGHDLGG